MRVNAHVLETASKLIRLGALLQNSVVPTQLLVRDTLQPYP